MSFSSEEETPLFSKGNNGLAPPSSFHIQYIDLNENIEPNGRSAIENKFIKKLDFYFLSAAMLGYFIKALNQTNITTAYINGMNEYYNMYHNELNYLTSLWTAGYILGQLPASFIINKVDPNLYLGVLELIWSVLTLSMVFVSPTNFHMLYVIRFLVGLAESSFFPIIQILLGSWYNSRELSKRATLFSMSSSVASFLSGPLQQFILNYYKDSSLPAFKWMFLYDSMISLPIAVYTLMVIPNFPYNTKAWYFDHDDKLVALERRRMSGAGSHSKQPYTLKLVKSYFNTWHIWLFPLIFLGYNNCGAAYSQPTFTSWMKYDLELDPKYYNLYPSIVSVLGIISCLGISFIADYFNGELNWAFIILNFVFSIIGCILLAIWDIPLKVHWTAYVLIGINNWGQPQIFSWLNKLLAHDDMKRGFLVTATNVLSYVTGAIIPLFVWNTKDQPRYFIGFVYTTWLAGMASILTIIAFYYSMSRDRVIKLSG